MWINPSGHAIVGSVLERVRKDAGITQQDLAKRLGKPQSFVSSYESGQRRVDILELLVIAKEIGGDPEKIFREILGEIGS